jgi:hypothetical protein
VETALPDDSNGQFGQYTTEAAKHVAAPTDVTWTCINTVTKSGTPLELDMSFWVAERTPPVALDGVAL